MAKLRTKSGQSQRSSASELFLRADEQWDRGEYGSALRLFLASAKAGDLGAQINVGYFYDKGIGVAPDRSKALYWYKRAYRRGDASAAGNVGTIWRDAQNRQRALSWFQKAVRLGDDGANLQIAKYYLRECDPEKAGPFLDRVCKSQRVSQAEVEEARSLLKEVKKKLSTKSLPRAVQRLRGRVGKAR